MFASPPSRLSLRLKSLLQKFLAVSDLESRRIDHHKYSLPTSQQLPFRIPNLALVEELPAVALALKGLDNNFLIHADRAQVFDRDLRGDCAHVAKPANLAHGFVQHGGDDSSVDKPDRKSTRLNSSHLVISYAVFCLKKKKNTKNTNIQSKDVTKRIT